MADGIRLRDRLGVRLGAAFSATAVGAVVVALTVAWTTSAADVTRVREEQRDTVVADVVEALAVAHAAAGGWEDADLLPAHTLAASAGAVLTVATDAGTVLPVPEQVDDLVRRLRRHADTESSSPSPADAPSPTVPPAEEPHQTPTPDETPAREPSHDPDDAPRGPTPGSGGEPGGGDDPGGEDEGGAGPGDPAGADGVRGAADTEVRPLTLDDAVEVVEERARDVVVDGTVVGRATLLFTRSDRFDPVAVLRAALTRDLLLAGGAGAVLGLLVTAWVAPHLTRPLRRLTTAVDRLAHGARSARSDLPDAVGELGVLARSVDRMAADLEREDRLRRALVADVAHEVRTPLTVLLGEVEALQDGVVEPDTTHLASLHEEVLRLARLVEDLDAVAAAEAAGLDLRREDVDLSAVVRGALAGLAESLAARGVRVEADLHPVDVQGDPGRLAQVVRNLVTNAAKFSPVEGLVTIALAPEGDEAVLRVVDDGPGIPSADLPHVFERFWRGAAAAGTAGTGVGLAVVAELVAAHGGRVVAGNAPGRGAELTVRLPRVAPAPPVTRSWARPMAGPTRGA